MDENQENTNNNDQLSNENKKKIMQANVDFFLFSFVFFFLQNHRNKFTCSRTSVIENC